MAITNASRLADFRSGIGTQGDIIQVDNAGQEVGIGTTNPNATLTVGNIGASGTSIYVHGDGRITGVLTATAFYGDGSSLSGVGVPGVSTTGHSVFNTINASGIVTAASFSGAGSNLTGHSVFNTIKASGITTISATTSSTSTTTGALIVTGGVGIGKSLFVGEGISVGGTITYDDVTNVDSIGIVTAGKGFRATTGGIDVTSGISTFKGAHFDGGTLLKEKVNITAGKLSANLNIDLENGMIHHFTTTETTTAVPNIRVSGSVALNDMMAVGETITVSVITTAAAAGYSAQWTIDGSVTTEEWNGGSAPSAGGASGKDFYTLNIIKTANATFTVLANVSNFA